MFRVPMAAFALALAAAPAGPARAQATEPHACPARVENGRAVESRVPRISLSEAVDRVIAGAGVVRLRTVRGHCLRIFDRSDPAMRSRSAYVEGASGPDLARAVRQRLGQARRVGREHRFVVDWQRIALQRETVLGSETVDEFDPASEELDFEFIRSADPARKAFLAPPDDPLRNSYFVADSTEIVPLSIAGPLASYRSSGGIYVRDAHNPRGYRHVGATPPTVAYRSRAFGLSSEALTAANEGLFVFFDRTETARAIRAPGVWDQFFSLATPGRRHFVPPADFGAIDSILREILPERVRWRDGCFVGGFCNFAFVDWNDERRTAAVEFAVTLNAGARPDSASLHLIRVELGNPSPKGAEWLSDARRSGALFRASFSGQGALRLQVNDDPFARPSPSIGADER